MSRESAYRQMVADLAATGDLLNDEIAAQIANTVHAAHAAGEPWADYVLQRWDTAGASKDYREAYKELHSVRLHTRDGRVVKKTIAYSRPKRSAESGEVVGTQLQSFWLMRRPEIEDLLRDIATQKTRLAEVIETLQEVLAVMDRHPECETACDAWLAEGRGLDEIDLSVVAS